MYDFHDFKKQKSPVESDFLSVEAFTSHSLELPGLLQTAVERTLTVRTVLVILHKIIHLK